MALEVITLGGGCFWCTEAVYEHVDGVTAVESGYSNGRVAKPTYEQVCTGTTGCVEVIRVTFDTECITLREVLEIFFVVHDPTTLNRQGADVGTQYRSGIYFHKPEQEPIAREVMAQANEKVDGRLVTELLPVADYSKARGLPPALRHEPPQPGLLRDGRRAQGREVSQDVRAPLQGLGPAWARCAVRAARSRELQRACYAARPP